MLRIARQAGGGDEARRYRFGHRIIFVAEIDILGFEIGVGIVVADLGAEPVERLGQEAEARRGGEFEAIDARLVGAVARLGDRNGDLLAIDRESLVIDDRLEAAVELLAIDRSDERRVGREGVSTCSSQWWP